MWGSWNVALWAPSGHPGRCLIRISLILLRREWSKLDVQVVVCNWVGDPFKAWVAGSSPAALTIFFNRLAGSPFSAMSCHCPVNRRDIEWGMRGRKATLESLRFQRLNCRALRTCASFGIPYNSREILQAPDKDKLAGVRTQRDEICNSGSRAALGPRLSPTFCLVIAGLAK